jgi:GntR family transcriptional regulator, rspAB operon transcriptional repressor
VNLELARGLGSVAMRAEQQLLREIVSLELPPGTRLSEQEIAERYGISRQPVREALIALARARLVEVLPQRGTFVLKISAQTMREARYLREVIEVAVARRACAAFAPASREQVVESMVAQRQAAERGDAAAFHHCDAQFHKVLAEGAGCPLAWELVGHLKAHLDRVCRLTLDGVSPLATLIEQHEAIIAAIDRRDADAAEAAMRLHLTEILRALPEVEKAYPEYFK